MELVHSFSLQECNKEEIEQWVHEIRDVARNEIKIKISRNSNNGEDFTPILRKIHTILQQLTIKKWQQEGKAGERDITEDVELHAALRQLGSETILSLIINMSKISIHVEEMGKLLLDVLSYLMALDPSCPLSFPTIFASNLIYINMTNWQGAVDFIMSRLCYYALPLSIVYPHESKGQLDSLSMSATLMLVFDNDGCQPSHHLLITGVLMRIKINVCTDLLSVMAYGTQKAQEIALDLLLHYWPLQLSDYLLKDPYANLETPFPECEASRCSNPAGFLCLEGACATHFGKMLSKEGNKKLFALLCPSCDKVIHRSASTNHKKIKIVHAMRDVKPNCELRRACADQSSDHIAQATVTCFGESCTAIQNGHPVRMCYKCHLEQHAKLEDPLHVYQIGPQNPWTSDDLITSSALLEAVVKLLSFSPIQMERKESQRRGSSHTYGPSPRYSISVKNSREGICLLYQYCTPVAPLQQTRYKEWLEQLIASALEWLRLCNDLIENIIEEGLSVNSYKEHRGSFLVNYQKTMESVCSNHRELHGLVTNYLIPWLKSVCDTGNVQCIITCLYPQLLGHVQVGEMWRYSKDPIDRYRRTLSLVVLLMKNPILSQDSLDLIYNTVMPHWMDLLIELRNQPGNMSKLKDLFQAIFPRDLIHDIRIKRFEFIREKFFQKSRREKQRALFWLQDLSRLSVPVPYTSHIFEGSLHPHRKSLRRQGSEEDEEEDTMPMLRKESSGSISGYDSESGLVSQTSMDVHAIIQQNSALPRYILMLDIWFSQLTLNVKGTTLGYEAFQRLLLHMLHRDWGTNHVVQDHHDTSNTCLLCQAATLWYNLATRIIQYYCQEVDDDIEESADGGTSPTPKRGRVSIKFAIPATLKRKLTSNDLGSSNDTPPQNGATAGEEFEESWENITLDDKKKTVVYSKNCSDTDNVEEKDVVTVKPQHSPRDRRVPILPSRPDLELLSEATPPILTLPSRNELERNKPEQVSSLYDIFDLCVEKLSTSYHPDTTIQMIQLIHLLVTKAEVLRGGTETILNGAHHLFDKLWRLLESDVSYLNQSCVGLLLSCQNEIVLLESSTLAHLSSSYLWGLLQEGFSHQGWRIPFKTADKLTMILQFMPGIEGLPLTIWHPHVYTELTLAHAFCKMVRLLQDKDSKVSTRVRFCLCNLKQESLDAIKKFIVTLFIRMPSHRSLVLQTLSLLNSALPQLSFLTLALVNQLLGAADMLKSRDTEDVFNHINSVAQAQKKMSDVSTLSAHKEPRPSTTSSAFSMLMLDEDDAMNIEALQLHCDTATLLLEFIASTNSNFDDSALTPRMQRRITRHLQEESTSETIVSLLERLIGRKPPYILCRSRIYETFIIKLCKILDINYEFCQTKTMIPFVLRLLGYSVTSTLGDYPFQNTSSTLSRTPYQEYKCSFTLGNLPSHLQAPWLRVLFIVLYKYSDLIVQNDATERYLLYCIEIVVNTILYKPHTCSLQQTLPSDGKTPRPTKSSNISSFPESPHSPPADVGTSLASDSPAKLRSINLERRPLAPVPEESSSFSFSKAKQSTMEPAVVNKAPPPLLTKLSMASISSTYTSSLSMDQVTLIQEPGPNVCQFCQQPTDIYTEEVIALSVLCLGTCSHRIPNLVSSHLVTWIIPSISKVVIAGHYYWQDSSSLSDPPPGSGMSIAKQFLLTVLTQFAERRVFVYLFRHDHKELKDVVFRAVVSCLTKQQLPAGTEEEEEIDPADLTLASPVEYFLEDINSSTHFDRELTTQSLLNLAFYLELLPENFARYFWGLTNLDIFLKKLKELPTIYPQVLHVSFNTLLRVIIQLLKFADPNLTGGVQPTSQLSITAIVQEFPEIISEGLHNTYCPAGGLVTLVGVWYKAFLQSPSRRREVPKKFVLLKLLVEEFSEGLYPQSLLLPENIISLCQTFLILLNEYTYLGYIDTLWEERFYMPQLRDQEIPLSALVNSGEDSTGIESLFTDSMRVALHYLAMQLPQTSLEIASQVKLTLAQLVALRVNRTHHPLGLVQRIVEGEYSFSWIEKSTKSYASKQRPPPSLSFANDHISSLMLLGWLLMGCLCHNSVHSTVTSACLDKIGVISNECEILIRLGSAEKTVDNILRLVLIALQNLVENISLVYWGLNCILSFCTIWTVYTELHVADQALPEIANFWRMVVDKILELPNKSGMMMLTHDIVEAFCEQTLIPLKKASSGISCFSLLLPTWKRVINMLTDPEEANLPDYSAVTEIGMDAWFREMLRRFTELESNYLS